MSLKNVVEVSGVKFEIDWTAKLEDVVYCTSYDVFGERSGDTQYPSAGTKLDGFDVPYFGTLWLDLMNRQVYTSKLTFTKL